MPGTFEIKRGGGGQYRFDLKAANGETLLTSYTYPSLDKAKGGIEQVRANAVYDIRFLWKTSRADERYFVLETAQGQVLGKSQKFASEAQRDAGIELVKIQGPSAIVDDRTS